MICYGGRRKHANVTKPSAGVEFGERHGADFQYPSAAAEAILLSFYYKSAGPCFSESVAQTLQNTTSGEGVREGVSGGGVGGA